ncbi:EexN family lipoprotein [Providencia vermicola]|uniref:EexN family lipoprotein n=1 Tax=Providencia vermicola TaxID=333965 RepID=UPI0032DBC544
MNKLICFIGAIFITVSTSACNDQKSEAWYKEHPKETYTTYSECLKSGEASDNCEFAYRASKMFARSENPEINQKFIELFKKKEENRKKLME